MLGEKFTGAELAAEVNDKISLSEGGQIGNIKMSPEDGLTQVVDAQDIPFRPFVGKQYVGTYKNGTTGVGIAATKNIDVGFKPSLVIIFNNAFTTPNSSTTRKYGDSSIAIVTTDTPFACSRGNLVEIIDNGFSLRSYTRVSQGDVEYPGFNISDNKYIALVFP